MLRLSYEIEKQADEIRRTLPENAQEGKVSMTFDDWDEDKNFEFRTEADVEFFC